MRRRVPRSDSNRRRGTRTVGVRVANRRASRGRRGGGRGVRADAHRAAASVRRGTRRGAHAARLRRGGWIRRGDVDRSRVRRRLRRDEDVVRGGGGRARRGRSRDGRGGGRGRHPAPSPPRASGVRAYAVDVVESVAAETSSYAPDAETFAAMSQVRNPDVAGSKPAVVAWSASRTGVCYYAGRATAGKVVVFGARRRVARWYEWWISRSSRRPRASPSPPANAAETSSSSAATRAPSGSKFHRRWCPGSSRN